MQSAKAIAFDLDGTLIKETCWGILHAYFKVDWNTTQRNIEDFAAGRITFQELVNKEIRLWRGSDRRLPHINEIEKALEKYTLLPNARETFHALRSRGYTTAIITYAVDILARRVARNLGIDHYVANTLEIDPQGFLTGNQENRVQLNRKKENLQELSSVTGISPLNFVAVGDTVYDLDLFEAVGFSIALNPKDEEVKRRANIVLETDDLSKILAYL